MDSDGPVAMLRRMVQIDSVTGSEDELSEYLVTRMRALGFAARRDVAGNAIGEIGDPDGPVIMLLGHLDTVPGGLPVFERGGALHGRGVVDAKGPLAALLWAAARAGARCPARLVMGRRSIVARGPAPARRASPGRGDHRRAERGVRYRHRIQGDHPPGA